MGLLGATILGGLGAVLGGPIGAAIGGTIGGMIDNEEIDEIEEGSYLDEDEIDEEEYFTIFITTLSLMLGKMIRADGVISDKEIIFLKIFLEKTFKDKDIISYMFEIIDQDNDRFSIYEVAYQYSRIMPHEMCVLAYKILVEIAISDDDLDSEEDEILRKIPTYLDISESYYTDLVEENFNYYKEDDNILNISDEDIQRYYDVLGVSANDTNLEIKKQYRKIVSEYHPDKIESKGLPKEFIKFANEQVQKINEAYSIIMEYRGIV